MKISASYTDLYELTMAQVYFHKNNNKNAVFDYYFRTNPFKGGYTVFAGLEDFLQRIDGFVFNNKDINYLNKLGFDNEFLDYLKTFKFNGKIYSVKEGELVFANTPIMQVEGAIIECQILETFLLNFLNFQTLIATKSRRIFQVAQGRTLMDMGLRRAHATGGYYATRASIIGGFDGTSNVIAGDDFDIPVTGTMSHSYIQSYESELQAFRDFAEIRPDSSVFLLDTYNTLKSGVPNAITAAKELENKGHKLLGVRLDSGDLAYLSKQTRKMLDNAGLNYVKIVVSNQLDEYIVKSLLEQDAPIDIFGVGTSLVTGKPDASLDGVYKLAEFDGKAQIKISDNIEKISFPCKKQLYRTLSDDGKFLGADIIALCDEVNIDKMFHPFDNMKNMELKDVKKESLLELIFSDNQKQFKTMSVKEIAEFSKSRFELLSEEYKRFENPHIYKVGLSEALKSQRDSLISKHL